jgi:hypothetical protein
LSVSLVQVGSEKRIWTAFAWTLEVDGRMGSAVERSCRRGGGCTVTCGAGIRCLHASEQLLHRVPAQILYMYMYLSFLFSDEKLELARF